MLGNPFNQGQKQWRMHQVFSSRQSSIDRRTCLHINQYGSVQWSPNQKLYDAKFSCHHRPFFGNETKSNGVAHHASLHTTHTNIHSSFGHNAPMACYPPCHSPGRTLQIGAVHTFHSTHITAVHQNFLILHTNRWGWWLVGLVWFTLHVRVRNGSCDSTASYYISHQPTGRKKGTTDHKSSIIIFDSSDGTRARCDRVWYPLSVVYCCSQWLLFDVESHCQL